MTDARRDLPSVDALLSEPGIAELLARLPRSVVVRAVREAIAAARGNGGSAPREGWAHAVAARAGDATTSSLEPVINATGVVLHTNLGRATLPDVAIQALERAAREYAAVEYDLGRGARGSRHTHCRDLLTELTGAADALVVNNAAAGLLLALTALARDGDVVVSRGELVEIGGAFRIPEIMARSGARLVEIGATNRTHVDDYVRALTLRTRLLLKVHRSNFTVQGFTSEVEATAIATLARERGLASLFDLGSGLMMDLAPWGLTGEPTVAAALASGVDLVVFSGDKLLGGPQAGIMVGRAGALSACRNDPLARALRPDKLTLAALEATLALYRDPAAARQQIPVLRMLTETTDTLRSRAVELAAALPRAAGADVVVGESEVGGGSFPGAKLPTSLVRLRPIPGTRSPDSLLAKLRASRVPVIGRIESGAVVLDPRTILPHQHPAVVAAVTAALA
jgi:L-seryl-tRNA(Ser) seleniumtransferase